MVFGVCLFWVSFNNNLVGVRLITRFYWLSDNFGCLIGLFSVFWRSYSKFGGSAGSLHSPCSPGLRSSGGFGRASLLLNHFFFLPFCVSRSFSLSVRLVLFETIPISYFLLINILSSTSPKHMISKK